MNMPKNSAEVPMSDSKISTSRLAIQMTAIGPRSRPRGRSIPITRRPASDSTSRFLTR